MYPNEYVASAESLRASTALGEPRGIDVGSGPHTGGSLQPRLALECAAHSDLSTPPTHPPGRCDLIGACHQHGVAQPSPVHPIRKHLDKRVRIGESF